MWKPRTYEAARARHAQRRRPEPNRPARRADRHDCPGDYTGTDGVKRSLRRPPAALDPARSPTQTRGVPKKSRPNVSCTAGWMTLCETWRRSCGCSRERSRFGDRWTSTPPNEAPNSDRRCSVQIVLESTTLRCRQHRRDCAVPAVLAVCLGLGAQSGPAGLGRPGGPGTPSAPAGPCGSIGPVWFQVIAVGNTKRSRALSSGRASAVSGYTAADPRLGS